MVTLQAGGWKSEIRNPKLNLGGRNDRQRSTSRHGRNRHLLTLALGYWVSPYWYLFTAFVGLNLLQSAFTKWCPAMTIFRKLGLQGELRTAPWRTT